MNIELYNFSRKGTTGQGAFRLTYATEELTKLGRSHLDPEPYLDVKVVYRITSNPPDQLNSPDLHLLFGHEYILINFLSEDAQHGFEKPDIEYRPLISRTLANMVAVARVRNLADPPQPDLSAGS